jgi:hypothetical protein
MNPLISVGTKLGPVKQRERSAYLRLNFRAELIVLSREAWGQRFSAEAL